MTKIVEIKFAVSPSNESWSEAADRINRLLTEGWELHGPLIIEAPKQAVQPMVRREPVALPTADELRERFDQLLRPSGVAS